MGVAAIYFSQDGTITRACTIQIERDEAVQTVDGNTRRTGESRTGRISVPQTLIPKVVKGGRFCINGTPEVWTVATTPTVANGQNYCKVEMAGIERLMDRRAKE